MKTKIDWKQVARLVAGLLALTFVVVGVLYVYAVVKVRTSFGPLFGTYIEEKQYSLADFFFPLLLTLASLLLFVYAFFAKKKHTLLIVATSVLALAYIAFALFHLIYSADAIMFGTFVLLALITVYLAFNTKNTTVYIIKIALSVISLALYIFAVINLGAYMFSLLNEFPWTEAFFPITIVVPFVFAIAHSLAMPEVAEVAEVQQSIEAQEEK